MQVILLLALAAASSAFPSLLRRSKDGVFTSFHESFDPSKDEWQKLHRHDFKIEDWPYRPPGPGDVRSACPFLSTCANHGILPRNGKNIHFESLYRCVHFGGFGKTLFRTSRASFAKIVEHYRVQEIKTGKFPVRPRDRISLDETAMHGPIEHDLSFTRLDVGTDPTFDLNRTAQRSLDLVKGLIAYTTKKHGCSLKKEDITEEWLLNPRSNSVDDKCYLDKEDMGHWFQVRRNMEKERHKQLGRPIEFGPRELIAASGEATFLLHLMGRDGKISAEYARVFLVHQRFPDGWKPIKHTFHFPLALPHILGMSASYLKPRSDVKCDVEEMAKWSLPKHEKDVYNLLISDSNSGACTGDKDTCPSFEDAMKEDD